MIVHLPFLFFLPPVVCRWFFTVVFFAEYWNCGRKRAGTRPGRAGARRTTSSTSWPKCCRCRRPSRRSWTRRPSYGWPYRTWSWETSRDTATRRGRGTGRSPRPKPLKVSGGTCNVQLATRIHCEWSIRVHLIGGSSGVFREGLGGRLLRTAFFRGSRV